MDGRAFLDVARELITGRTEAHWRAAAGRAYYAMLLECRDTLDRWGFALPPRLQVHAFVRLRYSFAADADLKRIGTILDYLSQLRNRADYETKSASSFTSDQRAQSAIADAAGALALLHQIESDPGRRTAAIATIRTAWP